MRLAKAWTIASKDFRVFMTKKSILYSIIGFQVLVSVGLPLIIRFVEGTTAGAAVLAGLINAFSFWLVMEAYFIPTGIASYSLVGEKVQKSLEPLLATPTTDEEILVGKVIAALIPAIISTYIGAAVFVLLVDVFTFGLFHYLYLPNWDIGVMLLLLAPLACLLSVGVNVLISSRSNDVRAAQQLGLVTFLPFGAVYVLAEINVISLTIANLLLMSAAVFLLDIIVFYVVRATFQREEILTRWR